MKHPLDDFLITTVQAFDSIAAGRPPDCPQTILDALLDRGFICRSVRVIGRDSLGPVVRHGYMVPPALHSRWRAFSTRPAREVSSQARMLNQGDIPY
jgi:hypothetical protein